MRRSTWMACLALLFASMARNASADSYLPPIGGAGGGQFIGACKPSEMLTGFQLRIIDGGRGSVPGVGSFEGLSGYLDALRPVCAVATSATRIGTPTLAGSWGGVAAGDQAAWQSAGFFGGTATVSNNAQLINRLCPVDQPLVSGVTVNYGKRGGFLVVYSVHLSCGLAAAEQGLSVSDAGLAVRANQRATRSAPDSSAADAAALAAIYGESRKQSCPRGPAAIGAHGRAGALVDAVGLICGAPRVTPASKPPVISARTSASSNLLSSLNAGQATPQPQPPSPALDAANPAIIYGTGADGILRWYRHNGATNGVGANIAGSWQSADNVSSDWGGFKQIFTGGNGVIYGITQDGKLLWYRHAAFLTGESADAPGAWFGAREVGGGWGGYRHAFSAGDGIIYAITEDGQLLWFRHTGFADGRAEWEGPIPLTGGWSNYEQVFSGGAGVIYAIGADGILKWNRHDGYQSGANDWRAAKDVGRGWNGFRSVFSAGNGIIYAIAPDGLLRWYRHNGYLDGRGLESPNAWQGRTDVGHGWNSFVSVVAQF
ncbi:MAG TPA: tachylectin-related carbohydrate-binding protein [Steroidobacteraceae bacterium]